MTLTVSVGNNDVVDQLLGVEDHAELEKTSY
jgi:hypothetical protein